jgi:hypothetical protein
MLNKKKVSIFLIISIVLLILTIIKFNYVEGIFNYVKDWINRNKNINKIENDIDDYPEYIYETFLDKDGNEVVIEMERRTGTIDGEDVIFYENTVEAEVVYCHFYQGVINSVDDEKIIFLVDKECKNVDLDKSYYDYEDVEDYEIEFNFDDYKSGSSNESLNSNSIFINSNEIGNRVEVEKLVGKYIVVQDFQFKDILTKSTANSLNFYTR